MVYFIAIITFDEAKDRRDYLVYMDKVKPIVEKNNGRYVVRSNNITVLNEGWKVNRLIVIAFENREQLERCFSSSEYQKIAYLRENSVNSKAMIVEAEEGEWK